MSITKETTARNPSVGADGGQPSKTYTLSIAETEDEFNENFSDSPDFFQKLQRAQDPDFLNTVSYNELMEETLAKAEHFRSLWYQKLQEENEMKARIREAKAARKEQEKTYKARERER